MDPDEDSDNDFYDCVEDINDIGKFYAIALPQEKWTDRKGVIAVDLKDAMKKLKEIKGSRLKVFQKISEAERFAETPAESLLSPQSKEKIRMRRDVDPFPNVSQRDLNEFRMCIDRGESNRIEELIWNNPRHLVNESDFPTVLQVRFRYNAIHQCCHRGKSDILRQILTILNCDEFWRSLHPTVDEMTHMMRKHRLLDLFLNSPDVGCLETPLHFAAKFGHVECVKALVEHPACYLQVRNREGRTPGEIVCSRCVASSERSERRRKILDILRGQFVLLVSEDGCSEGKVLPPCDWRQYDSWRQNGSGLRAFAGPMCTEDASQFYQLLSRPVRKLARTNSLGRSCSHFEAASGPCEFDLFAAKLADTEKGYERAGRHLAAKFGVAWMEFWPFIGDFVDLSSDAGLSLLEKHVSQNASQNAWMMFRESSMDETSEVEDVVDFEGDSTASVPVTPDSSVTTYNGDSWLSPLSRLFSRLSIRSPAPTDLDSSSIPPPSPSPFCTPRRPVRCHVTSTPKRGQKVLRRSLTGQPELDRMDVQVFRALEQLDVGRLSRFPQVRQWREDVAEEVLQMSPRHSHSGHHAFGRIT